MLSDQIFNAKYYLGVNCISMHYPRARPGTPLLNSDGDRYLDAFKGYFLIRERKHIRLDGWIKHRRWKMLNHRPGNPFAL